MIDILEPYVCRKKEVCTSRLKGNKLQWVQSHDHRPVYCKPYILLTWVLLSLMRVDIHLEKKGALVLKVHAL